MLNLKKAIYGKLANSLLTADIGGRFFDTQAIEGAEYPYAVYMIVSGYPEKTFTEDFEVALIQFSLFSATPNDSTEIETMFNHLKTLFDECALSVTGADWFHWMKRQNATLMVEDHTTLAGTIQVFHYAVDYEVMISIEYIGTPIETTYYPIVSGDDGVLTVHTSSGLYTAINFISFGKEGTGVNYRSDLFVRFPNVLIRNSSIIISAYIRFTGYNNQTGETCNVNCYFNDEDDAIAPTTFGEFETLSKTAAILWSDVDAVADGVTIDSPELKTILQEIVNRPGWASGQAMMAILKNNVSSDNAYRNFSSIDYLSGAEKAELHITYSTE